jgi:prepilin-type N-terminal cleavage/methylation domain-containing protein
MATHKSIPPTSKQSGFTLVEVSIVLALAVLSMIYAAKYLVAEAEKTVATATGVYMLSGKNALDNYVLNNYSALSNGQTVTGVTAPLQPTVAELVALKWLPTGFPTIAPSGQTFNAVITPDTCPGVACKLPTLFHSTTAYADKSGVVRIDLASEAANAAGGFGGFSYVKNSNLIRGGNFSVTNPSGSVPGVVASAGYLDTTVYNQFVKMRDDRNPDLQGGLTISGGTTTLNSGLTVIGTSNLTGNTTVTGTIAATGAISSQAALNVVEQTSGCVRASVTPGSAASGGSIALRNSACLQSILLSGQTGVISATGDIEIRNAGGTLIAAMKADGTITATTRIDTPVAKLTSSFAGGAACSGAQENDVAQNASSPGLVVCRSGIWIPTGITVSVLGAACGVPGGMGITSGGLGLFCQGGIWITNTDRIGRYASADSFVAHHNTLAAKPSCSSNGTPRIYYSATGGETAPAVGARSVYYLTQDQGTHWLLTVTDAANAAIPDGQGLVNLGCWYN